jgi:hypothetical protein
MVEKSGLEGGGVITGGGGVLKVANHFLEVICTKQHI